MDIASLTASAVVPSLILMWYFHQRDAFPEPPRVLWTTFGLGILITVPVIAIAWPLSQLAENLDQPLAFGFVNAFLGAAIPEELFKFAVLWWYSARHFEFDEPMDGIVYGVAASLGFATLENVLYVAGGGMEVAVLRALTAVPCHAFLGAIMGYFVGKARFPEQSGVVPRASGGRVYVAWALAVPILLHGLYDWPLLAGLRYEDGSEDPLFILLLLGVPVILIGQAVWSVRTARRLRRDQHSTFAVRPEYRPPVAVPPPPAARQALAWAVVVIGALAACGGGLLVLGVLTGVLFFGTEPEEVAPLFLGTIVLGGGPLVFGLVLFRWGVRRLNRASVNSGVL